MQLRCRSCFRHQNRITQELVYGLKKSNFNYVHFGVVLTTCHGLVSFGCTRYTDKLISLIVFQLVCNLLFPCWTNFLLFTPNIEIEQLPIFLLTDFWVWGLTSKCLQLLTSEFFQMFRTILVFHVEITTTLRHYNHSLQIVFDINWYSVINFLQEAKSSLRWYFFCLNFDIFILKEVILSKTN